jgi:hypothetical protein
MTMVAQTRANTGLTRVVRSWMRDIAAVHIQSLLEPYPKEHIEHVGSHVHLHRAGHDDCATDLKDQHAWSPHHMQGLHVGLDHAGAVQKSEVRNSEAQEKVTHKRRMVVRKM